MVVCPNCNHDNPEGANLCETCYTPLPLNIQCPNCDASILANSTFCGQCGFDLLEQIDPVENAEEDIIAISSDDYHEFSDNDKEPTFTVSELEVINNVGLESEDNLNESSESKIEKISSDPITVPSFQQSENDVTQLQIQKAILLHIQTNQEIELPPHLQVIHLGKENERIPPDIDVSGFPDSQFVSRVHADIRVEDDAFYIEDTGSANGTYVNHIPLPKGNRHRLRSGDRVALGKEDKVSFIFQLIS